MKSYTTASLLCALLLVGGASVRAQTRAVPAEPPASLQGVITQLGTAQTLSKVTVELRGMSQSVTTTTEGDGRYYFTNVKPGTYHLFAKRSGFITAEYAQQWVNGPGQPVVAAAGANLQNLNMFLVGAGTISGRITDAAGRPIANAQVSALKVAFQGLRRVLETVQETRTNELGEYRLFWLLPRRYYLAAVSTTWNQGNQGNLEIITRGGVQQVITGGNQQARTVLGARAYNATASGSPPQPTFYPSVASADSAMSVDVSSGVETREVDIRLIPVGTYHVCGVVSVNGELPGPAPRGQPEPNPGISVAPGFTAINGAGQLVNAAGQVINAAGAVVAQPRPDICADVVGKPLNAANISPIRLVSTGTIASVSNAGSDIYTASVDPATGRFIFRNVRSGSYELSTIINGLNARVDVEVRDSHVENASLILTRGFDLTVRLLAEEGVTGKVPPLAQLRPYLGDDPPSPREPFLGEFTPDGRTTIKNVPADEYRVYLEPLLNSAVAPPRTIPPALQEVYVKLIQLGSADALNAPLRFSGQPDVTLDIVIGANPGVLEGQVLDATGAPARGAIVTLLPNATSRNRVFRMDMYRMVISDLNGRYKATGIPPGDYKVFAWAGIERDAWMDPDLQRAYEDRGVSVKVEERSAVTLDLRLIVPGI